MTQRELKLKLILILSAILIVWFLLFGIRLVGYFSAISDRGLREVACTGCSDLNVFFSTAFTVSVFIIIPLITPVVLAFHWFFKNKKLHTRIHQS
ncbi:hypothetical protein [Jeotgalibacillus salarius]|uniref:Uncharacterized protein n=1 Tax=Jeotgalibacillus salarius TaxID=546023 RepID=A0A4Y8LF39_9BACL|nr:hypothetical protein [Jeotgalibacillus salarius]TFE00653.1 hypothetical protein E2626_11815 [Jeotgalibacillus salarius]